MIIETKMRIVGITLEETIQILRKTTSAIIGSHNQAYLIPPSYSDDFRGVLEALGIQSQESDFSILKMVT